MAASKRMRAIWEAEAKAAEEKTRLNLTPQKWSEQEIIKLNRIQAILEEMKTSQFEKRQLVDELLKYENYFQGFGRITNIKGLANKYGSLKNSVEMADNWRKIQGFLTGLQSELNTLRRSKLEGGTSDQ